MKHFFLFIATLLVSFLNAQTVSFTQPSGSPISTGNMYLRGLTSCDVNNDGKKDILVGNSYNQNLHVLLGDGLGHFTATNNSPLVGGSGPIYIAVSDFNNDGNVDIASANYYGNDITTYFGDGTGNFIFGESLSIGNLPYCIQANDFNLDGESDLVAVAAGSNQVYVFLGNGNGNFSAAIGSPFYSGTTPFHVSSALLNSDNIPDLIVANGGSNNVTIFFGYGNGSFNTTTPTYITTGSEPRTISVKDLNGDSNQDFIVANASSNNLNIFLGDGNGNFTQASGSPIAAGNYPYQTAINDYNSDGINDVAVSNGLSTNIVILLGNGNGTFYNSINSPISLTKSTQSIISDDFNNDSKPDIICSNYITSSTNNLFVLINNNYSVGEKEFEMTQTGRVFPNPTNDFVYFEFEGKFTLSITNNLGQEMTIDNNQVYNNKTKIALEHLSKGIYYYNVIIEEKFIKTGKIIIE